jgi:hypothetical protein
MARLSSKLLLGSALLSLIAAPVLAQEKSGEGGSPKDQKPGDGKPNDGKSKDGLPRDGNPDDDHPKETPPKDTPRPRRGGGIVPQSAGPLKPNMFGACPGNYVTNGDFEDHKTILGTENNIQFATGWSGIWAPFSTADLWRSFGAGPASNGGFLTVNGGPYNVFFDKRPGVFASFWTTNDLYIGVDYREGILNLLALPIEKSTGDYTLSFVSSTILTSKNPARQGPAKVGLYAAYYPPTQPRSSMGITQSLPKNKDYFGPNQVVKIGTVTVPWENSNVIHKMKRYEIQFSSSSFSAAQFGKMTHLMIATDDDTVTPPSFLNYLAFDDFCLTKDSPKSAAQKDAQ